ncbi:MAG: hypothetical protein R6U95_00005, partial [Bacteroidales bacterium]
LGWRLITAQGEQFVHHGGYVDGYRNEIAFCPNKKIGIVYLSNSPHLSVSEIVPHFMNSFIEYADTTIQNNMDKQLALQ